MPGAASVGAFASRARLLWGEAGARPGPGVSGRLRGHCPAPGVWRPAASDLARALREHGLMGTSSAPGVSVRDVAPANESAHRGRMSHPFVQSADELGQGFAGAIELAGVESARDLTRPLCLGGLDCS